MKKITWALTLSLLLALSFSACGGQSGSENDASQGTSLSPGQSGAEESGTGSGQDTGNDPGAGSFGQNMPNLSGIAGLEDGSLSFSSLTEWYNSETRTQLEDILNEFFSEASSYTSFSYAIEEPDILIYNYQYTLPLSSLGMSHEEAAAFLAAYLQENRAAVISDIRGFQALGIPLRLIRMNYLDTDGSLVYTTDVTEASGEESPDSPTLPGDSGTAAGIYGSLQEWMDSSEDASLTIQSTNQSLAATGITFDLAVEGNTLIYQYCLPDGFFTDGLAEEEQTAAFDSMVDAGSASAETVLAMFAEKYGLTLDAIRFTYYSKDGTVLYSRDVTP